MPVGGCDHTNLACSLPVKNFASGSRANPKATGPRPANAACATSSVPCVAKRVFRRRQDSRSTGSFLTPRRHSQMPMSSLDDECSTAGRRRRRKPRRRCNPTPHAAPDHDFGHAWRCDLVYYCHSVLRRFDRKLKTTHSSPKHVPDRPSSNRGVRSMVAWTAAGTAELARRRGHRPWR
jgi:hypothetical protein